MKLVHFIMPSGASTYLHPGSVWGVEPGFEPGTTFLILNTQLRAGTVVVGDPDKVVRKLHVQHSYSPEELVRTLRAEWEAITLTAPVACVSQLREQLRRVADALRLNLESHTAARPTAKEGVQ